MKRKAEFKDQSVAELQAQHADLRKEIFKMRNELSGAHKLDKPHLLRQKKRDCARILTLLNQKGNKS